VSLAAAEGPGHTLRNQYEQGQGIPGLIAIAQDATGTARAVCSATRKPSAHRAGVQRRRSAKIPRQTSS